MTTNNKEENMTQNNFDQVIEGNFKSLTYFNQDKTIKYHLINPGHFELIKKNHQDIILKIFSMIFYNFSDYFKCRQNDIK